MFHVWVFSVLHWAPLLPLDSCMTLICLISLTNGDCSLTHLYKLTQRMLTILTHVLHTQIHAAFPHAAPKNEQCAC